SCLPPSPRTCPPSSSRCGGAATSTNRHLWLRPLQSQHPCRRNQDRGRLVGARRCLRSLRRNNQCPPQRRSAVAPPPLLATRWNKITLGKRSPRNPPQPTHRTPPR